MRKKIRIVGISDVSLGYGSPQVAAMVDSLILHYDEAEGIVLEPDQPDNPMCPELFPNFQIRRVFTNFPVYSAIGRIEYIEQAADIVRKLQPDVLVIFCTFTLPVAFKLRHKPLVVIYYNYEYVPSYGKFDIEMNRHIGSRVDVTIYPEENRAANDIRQCGYRPVPTVVLFNSINPARMVTPIASGSRLRRILYAGTIDRKRTNAHYFLDEKIRHFPIDIYGSIGGRDKESLRVEFENLFGDVRYRGYVSSQKLAELRRQYLFSVVMWAPIDCQHYNACPNKFFESIAAGVPPITAPHPQCKMIVDRYQCGIVMDNWEFDSFYAALDKAMAMIGTPQYDAMVQNCRRACEIELNWEMQFNKLKPHLKAI